MNYRSSKAPRGSYLSHIAGQIPMPLIKIGLSYAGTSLEQTEHALQYCTAKTVDDGFHDFVDGGAGPLVDIYNVLNYVKRRPTDLALDLSVLNHLESTPLKEEITIPEIDKGMVWIDISRWNMKINPDRTGQAGSIETIKGILLVKVDETMHKWGYNPVSGLAKEKFGGDQKPTHWAYVHATNNYYYAYPLSDVLSFGELAVHEQRDGKDPYMGYSKAMALGLTAFEMIKNGMFERDSTQYADQRLPLGKKKIKAKGKKKARFEHKYREFRTTYFRHIDCEPKQGERQASSVHYTPRDVRSHYKERWVTAEYVESHNVLDDDILEIEDRTRAYKSGVATKTWVKIKLWYNCSGGVVLETTEPTLETEFYRA